VKKGQLTLDKEKESELMDILSTITNRSKKILMSQSPRRIRKVDVYT
jgi:hypothetical protein